MKRRKPLPRSTKPLKRGRVRRVNKERKAREFARAYGGEARLAWIHAHPCLATDHEWDFCDGKMEAAHTESGGTGRKADASTLVPLCKHHHRQLHAWGHATFERSYHISLTDQAAFCEAQWQLHVREGSK